MRMPSWEPEDRLVDFTHDGHEVWVSSGDFMGIPVSVVQVRRGSLSANPVTFPRRTQAAVLFVAGGFFTLGLILYFYA